MKRNKLVAALSAITLLAGAANAQLTIDQIDTGALTEIDSFYPLAEEIDFPALILAGGADAFFGLEVRTQGVIPPGQNIFLTIEIENGTLAANLDGSEISAGITGAVVDSGGAIGDTFVRYLITTDTLDVSTVAGLDGIALDLPVLVSSCSCGTSFNVTEFRTEGTGASGTDIEGGTAKLIDRPSGFPALGCFDTYEAELVPDSDIDFDNLSILDVSTGFTNFVDGPPANDTDVEARLGVFFLDVDTAVNIDLDWTKAAPSDVLGYNVDIEFTDSLGLVEGIGFPTGGIFFTSLPTPIVGNTISLSSSIGAGVPVETGDFLLSINGVDSVTPQEVDVSKADLFLDTSRNLLAIDPFIFAEVDNLAADGQVYGPFDWVSDGQHLVNSIFRVTGFDGQSDILALLLVGNSSTGLNGGYEFLIPASDVQGGEVRFNSAFLESLAGAFGTADIVLVFATNLDLDVDRLIAGPAQATVVPFGDGANQDGTGALAPADDPAGGVNGDDGSF